MFFYRHSFFPSVKCSIQSQELSVFLNPLSKALSSLQNVSPKGGVSVFSFVQ